MVYVCVCAGYWNIVVHGRKHSYRLYTKILNDAIRWTAALQGVIDSKTPIETPTLQLIRDIRVTHTHTHTHIKTHINTNTHTHTHMPARTHAHTHWSDHLYTCTNIHTHSHTNTHIP